MSNGGGAYSCFIRKCPSLKACYQYPDNSTLYSEWTEGAGIRNIFIYIGAFCTIKIPMLTFEIGFLGWKFSLLRTLLTLPMIILIGFIMERYLKNKKFEVIG